MIKIISELVHIDSTYLYIIFYILGKSGKQNLLYKNISESPKIPKYILKQTICSNSHIQSKKI